ncbi:MAG TPA: tetratricopeptide repeat protein [Chloroflexota bacterium]|nr:tetratricopeptide repeat protein [Chloroflexota bacterium]
MGTIRKLVEEAKAALMAGKAEAALGPCRAVLEHYPKHIEATCLLAEARRELRQLREAADLFERVIAADPESLIGHWGLSTILEEQGQAEAALYELQIAWDLNPGHPALREELVRLRAKLGWEAGEPELGEAGLARVYWRGHQYRRTILEARRVMDGSLERLDVAVLLCEALWRIGRLADAAEVAAEILAESPDCLKASLIRGYARLEAGTRAQDEARKLLGRALQLDPECRVASAVFVDREVPPPLVVQEVDLEAEPPSLLPSPTAEPAGRGSLWAIAEAPAGASAGPESGEPTELTEFAPVPRSVLAASLDVAPVGGLVHRAEVVDGDAPWPGVAADAGAPAAHPVAEPAPNDGEPVMRRLEDLAALAAAAYDKNQELADEPSAENEPAAEATAPAEDRAATVEAETPEAPVTGGEAATDEEETPVAVPVWMESGSGDQGATAGLDPQLYEEWADLLAEEVDLDPDAAARLEAALAEATGGTGAAGPWREIVLDGVSLAPPEAGAAAEEKPATEESAGEATRGRGAAPGEAVDAPAARRAPAAAGRPKSGVAPVERAAEDELAAVRAQGAEGDLDALAEAYRGLLRSRGDLATTVATEVRELVEANPEHAGLRRALGDAYMRCGRFQKAIEEYNRAVALQPPAAVA